MVHKALLVGINYRGRRFATGASAQLVGSHSDAKLIKKMLMECGGYADENITMLLDDSVHLQPTRANIISEMKKLVGDAKSGDHLFFHFSGHGVQVEDRNGDETDGQDEAIWPVDFVEGNEDTYIIDDDMRNIMVDRGEPEGLTPLPAGCHLTALFDSCHSGTALDLPVDYFGSPHVKTIDLPDVSTPRLQPILTPNQPSPLRPLTPLEPDSQPSTEPSSQGVSPTTEMQQSPQHHHHLHHAGSTVLLVTRPDAPTQPPKPLPLKTEACHGLLGLPFSVQSRARGAPGHGPRKSSLVVAVPSIEEKDVSLATVTSWAACADDESAYELKGGEGAMVQFFVESIYGLKPLTYRAILDSLSEKLGDYCDYWNRGRPEEEHIKQIPQLGSLHELNLDDIFVL